MTASRLVHIIAKVDGGIVDLAFTDSATYQLGLLSSDDSPLLRPDDAVHPAGDYRFHIIIQL